MVSKKKRIAVAAVVAAVIVAAWAGISYATNTPPFKKPKGTIEAAGLCPSLGASQEAADILNRILPYAAEYEVSREEGTPRGAAPTDVHHTSSCSISGDGRRLLLVRTEMGAWTSEASWREEVLGTTDGRKPTAFDAGRWAFTSTPEILRVGAVFSACLPAGDAGLSTSVVLPTPAPADHLDDLRRLTELAAEQAHEAARCTVPADTPPEVAGNVRRGATVGRAPSHVRAAGSGCPATRPGYVAANLARAQMAARSRTITMIDHPG
ncbi:hypothetical protein ABZ615_14635 [Streptomyces sp. NPDC007325]|uniref:hypothetical protein n=1 Tax=Streptomyces sp. NPDC007325 TaxID=3154588 RepID=UPI0033C3B9DB